MNQSDLKRFLKKQKPKVVASCPDIDIHKLKNATLKQYNAISEDFKILKSLHDQLNIYVDEQFNVVTKDIREEIHQQLAELETNQALELQTVQDSFGEQITALKLEITTTQENMDKSMKALSRKVDKNAKHIQAKISKLELE